ncbi:MAG: hypothetical protein LBE24_08165 [Methylobacillus sp.]|jgi:hypothetical protein|nr:hypothetical protein [Methylobacillus sp.]
MSSREITYQQAKQKAEKSLLDGLLRLGIHPTVSLLEERYAENEVCWIFFRSRAISIPIEVGMLNDAGCAFAVSKRGGAMLLVADNFDNDQELKFQMDRFATIHPDTRPDRFRQLWHINE